MAKSNAGSKNANSDLSPYLKARLRPFMQPKLWVSAGIFAMSAFVLVRMFMQPDQFLGQAGDDRGAAANVQANDSLSPEERAIAAELDDLEVLLKELDDEGTLEAAEAMVTPASSDTNQNSKFPDLEFKTPELEIPDVNYGQFDSLPLVDLTPRRNDSQTAIAGQPAGFVGVNSVSDNPALNLPVTSSRTTDDQTAVNPLQAALDRYAPQSSFSSSTGSNSSTNAGGALEQAISATESTAVQAESAPATSTAPATSAATATSSTPIAPTVSITNPTVTNSTLSTPTQATNPSDNAFTQLINPQSPPLQTSTQLQTPQLQTPQVATPQVVTPQVPQVTTPQFQTTPQFTTTPQFSSTPQFQTPVNTNTATSTPSLNQPTGTPVYQQSANGATNFGVPSRPPGQNIGGGQINTFSNP